MGRHDFTQHHFRMFSKVFVHKKRNIYQHVVALLVLHLVLAGSHLGQAGKSDSVACFTRQSLAEEQDIGRYFGTGVALEGIVWKSDSAYQVHTQAGNVLTCLRITAIHSGSRSDERTHTARTQFQKALKDKVIVKVVR